MSSPLKVGDKAPNFQFDTPWTSSQAFYKTTRHQVAVLVFLRYNNYPVCQMEMANLKRDIELFNQKETRVFAFLQSSIATLTPLLKKEDWLFDIVCDPKGTIYRLYVVEPGGLMRYFHPAGLIPAFRATCQGLFHKKLEGKETQLPAAFIIRSDKTVKYVYYGKHPSDLPKPSTLAEKLDFFN